MTTKKNPTDKELAKEVRALHDMLTDLQQEEERYRKPRKLVLRAFLRGIAYVLGGIVTVAVVIPIFLWLLRTVEWPSITAQFVEQVILQMEKATPPAQP